MKKSKIRGYIYDLEHKNKNYCFDKTLRILDISNSIYIDLIQKFDFKSVSNYRKSKYLFKEISDELNNVFDLLAKEKTLMATCLLRNVFEEMTYIMATSIQEDVDINIMTKAGYFNDIVSNNCAELFGNVFVPLDIKEIYSYLSKITHVTNVKEAVSYITGNKLIKKYINNEIKYVALIIENMYLTFLYKKANINDSMIDNIMVVSSYVDLINLIYFIAYSTGEQKRLESYFYGSRNQKYLKEKKDQIIEDFKYIQSSNGEISKNINKVSKELENQLKVNNYMDIVNTYLNM